MKLLALLALLLLAPVDTQADSVVLSVSVAAPGTLPDVAYDCGARARFGVRVGGRVVSCTVLP